MRLIVHWWRSTSRCQPCQEQLLPSRHPAWAGAQGHQGIYLLCAWLPQLVLSH